MNKCHNVKVRGVKDQFFLLIFFFINKKIKKKKNYNSNNHADKNSIKYRLC